MKRSFSFRAALLTSACASIILAISGCQLTENMTKADRTTNQEVQDYRDMLGPREVPLDEAASKDIPELKAYVADGSASLKPMPLVSISVNQTIPLRDALFELAKQADYDIQLDPRIRGSIIYTARNKPYDLVIDQISQIAGLRYSFDDDTIKIELDTPYTQNYKVEYLAMTRKTSSTVTTSTEVSGGESGGAQTGSSFSISGESKTDFWGELDTNIKQILEANSQINTQITASDPEISVTAAPPPVPPLEEGDLNDAAPQAGDEHSSIVSNYSAGQSVPAATNNSVPGSPGNVPTGSAVPPTTSPPDDQSSNQTPGVPTTATPQQVQLNVNSLPTVDTADGGTTTYQPSYSINKQAGLISVYATQKAHNQIATYLDLMRKAVTSQVLIEAKVLEVELSDEFSYGIDWSVFNKSDSLGASLAITRGALSPGEPATFVIQNGSNGIENLVSAIQRFGTVHALASPRLTVLNNQAAVLNVAENRVYFEIDATREEDDETGDVDLTIDSEIKNVPEGVLINVLPSIDIERNMVSMQVRPTISRIESTIPDPAVAVILASVGLADSGISSDIPVVSTKELDTMLSMRSGETLVMGGLLEDRTQSTQRAVPILGEVPILGAAFRGQEDAITKNEVIILIKATIINAAQDSIHNTDRELYRVYSQDRRPTKL
ncbi:MAG: type II and III secretion system family protein [Micavibrio aeruginosavorus]|uniref:Type II and III secretion system family protein n=1 Tax=Micavibrio aeruginosavorus TaxID=349221 RepID=A0A2W5HFD7_9BACT|nr:MAG: type II and III secretion system family protein [Micavibrio aeruginosavorus]